MRKTQAITLFAGFALLGACISCSKSETPDVPVPSRMPGVHVTLPTVSFEDATRGASMDNGFALTWDEGDRINIWSSQGTLLLYRLTEVRGSSADAAFDGGGFTLTDGESYYSLFPPVWDPTAEITSLPLSFRDQVQSASGDASHLKPYAFSYASATSAEGSTSFEYAYLPAFLQLNITLPAAKELRKVELIADSDVFPLEASLDVTSGALSPEALSSALELGVDGASPAETFVANMAVAPFGAAKASIRVTDSEGTVYTSPEFSLKALAGGKARRIAEAVYAGEEIPVASVGGVTYPTLAEAFAAVPADGTQTTVSLLGDVLGDGVVAKSGQDIVVDFGGGTYTVDGLVGSSGSKTLGMQLLKGSKVTLKNGTLTSATARMLVQNYADLTLENMILDGTQAPACSYVLSNNSGKVNIIGSTSIKAAAGMYALDVCWAPNKGYPAGTQITVNTTGTITGKILYDLWGTFAEPVLSTLEILAGNFESYALELDGTEAFKATAKDNISIMGGTFDADPSEYLAEGYGVSEEGGLWTVIVPSPVATVNGVEYPTLRSALAAIPADGTPTTLTLIEDVDLGSEGLTISEGQSVTLALGKKSITGEVNGKLITNNGTLTITGSTGTVANTETSAQGHDAIYNAAGATLTIKGGHFGDTDGDMTNANAANRGGAVRNFGTATISGGYFTACDNFTNGGFAYAIINDGDGELTISGGTYYGSNNGNVAVNDGTVLIKAGKFTVSGTKSYNCVYNYDGEVTITGGAFRKENHSAQGAAQAAILRRDADAEATGSFSVTGGTYYGGAVNDAYIGAGYCQATYESAGETVRQIVPQVEVTSASDVSATKAGVYTFASDVATTSNYAGGVLSSGYYEYDLDGHSVTTSRAGQMSFNFRGSQKAVFNGPGSVINEASGNACVWANGANVEVTINGGDFTATTDGAECIYCYQGNIIINGGTFRITGDNTKFLLNCYDANRAAGKAWITVKGGTFRDFNPADNAAEGEGTNFVASGYHVEADSVSEPGHILYTVVAD